MTDTMRPLPVDCSALLHGEPRLTTSSRLRLYLPLTPLAFTSTQSGKLHPCMTRIDRSRLVLWSQSSQVIQSYGSPSAAYGLMFLGILADVPLLRQGLLASYHLGTQGGCCGSCSRRLSNPHASWTASGHQWHIHRQDGSWALASDSY